MDYDLKVKKANDELNAIYHDSGPRNSDYYKRKEKLQQTTSNDISAARVTRDKRISDAEAKKESYLANLSANRTEILMKIKGNWTRFLRGEQMLDINISFASSTEISGSITTQPTTQGLQ